MGQEKCVEYYYEINEERAKSKDWYPYWKGNLNKENIRNLTLSMSPDVIDLKGKNGELAYLRDDTNREDGRNHERLRIEKGKLKIVIKDEPIIIEKNWKIVIEMPVSLKSGKGDPRRDWVNAAYNFFSPLIIASIEVVKKEEDFKILKKGSLKIMDGEGVILKSKISKVGSNGCAILAGLIKNGIVDDVSATKARLKSDLHEKEKIIRNIAKDKFDEIWSILLWAEPIAPWAFSENKVRIRYSSDAKAWGEISGSPQKDKNRNIEMRKVFWSCRNQFIKRNEFSAVPNGVGILNQLIADGILDEDGDIYLIHKLDKTKGTVEKIAGKGFVKVWEILKAVSEMGESDKDSAIAVNNWLKDNWEGKKGSKKLSEKRILSICKYYKD